MYVLVSTLVEDGDDGSLGSGAHRFYGVFPGSATQPAGAVENTVLPLDMAENSVDDMYNNCTDQMSKMAKKYLTKEKNENQNFTDAWDEGEQYYNEKWNGSKELGKEQIVALYAYTSGKVYREFNAAVRNQSCQYNSTFGYHALHFYLTVAVQDLKAKEKDLGKNCTTSFRRTKRSFDQNVLNTEIRFGSFASSSKNQSINAETFGDKSCFNIITCYGAEIANFSKYPNEEEVLIPPYEVFHVTDIQNKTENEHLPCDVVYTLKSTRTLSKLNCALVKKESWLKSLFGKW
ncbi:hypothetical protein L3Q82_023390 [Scortum barcoo]|uniref:Uncharacterized protein n=1 Tax=Scortum barcoo TaxID=214431 RepID=A0ACB8WY84_9TELE|nr:hypothetical protein L3Q82_023390 [Scortum barcoo]